MQPEILSAFAVPIAFTEGLMDEDANASLREWVLAEREQHPGIKRSNSGGWHSLPDLPNRAAEPLDSLFASVLGQVQMVHGQLCQVEELQVRYLLQAWATVLEQGDYMQIHDHADAHWSVVYYVDAGDASDPASGRISWINPIASHRALPGANLAPSTFTCSPRSGLLAIFPGWLRHCVEPYVGTRPRIVIAGNIEVQARMQGSSG